MFLLDTNVISELRRPSPSPNVLTWYRSVSLADLFLSVLVIGEIRQGIERLRRRDAARAAAIDTWLAILQTNYANRILPITLEIAETWGRMNAPQLLAHVDGLMAATAHVHGLTFVTRNTADVARTGVKLLDPFAL